MRQGREHDQHHLEQTHTRAAIDRRLDEAGGHHYLRDFIYGGIDGAVTTFAVVCGVAGAELSSAIIIILGVANLLGDGFSMAAGNFLGTRAEGQVRLRVREEEHEHIRRIPDGERREIRQIFARKGFEGDDLDRVVEVITADEGRWVSTMLTEEHGLPLDSPSPTKAAAMTLGAFIGIGLLPLIPFILEAILGDLPVDAFRASTIMTAIAFLTIGALKSTFVRQPWVLAALETLGVGGLAAGLAYLVGYLLRGMA